ncbi:periplasmic heavy metal sensor [candidate division KSB1 bacterium]|nr:periplasmic heavy metal sensor [candidate division KSB1 bacterium]
MDVFTNKKFTIITIVILVILNLGTLTMIWMTHIRRPLFRDVDRPPRGKHGAVHFLTRELGLSDAQVRKVIELERAHREKTDRLIDEIHLLKHDLMTELFESKPDTQKAGEIIRQIGDRQELIERLMFSHFHDLKNVCEEHQQERLRKLLDDFFNSRKPPRMAPPPADRPPMPQPRLPERRF